MNNHRVSASSDLEISVTDKGGVLIKKTAPTIGQVIILEPGDIDERLFATMRAAAAIAKHHRDRQSN